jgi:hypothetical protein
MASNANKGGLSKLTVLEAKVFLLKLKVTSQSKLTMLEVGRKLRT